MNRSINSRRGGGGSTADVASWKYVFLASLFLLVCFLARLNFQLVKQLGHGVSKVEPASTGGLSSSVAEDERRVSQLRKNVSEMKDSLNGMKGVLGEIERKQAELSSGVAGSSGSSAASFPRLTCSSEIAALQTARINKRFNEWWSHSACPDQVWMEGIHGFFDAATPPTEKSKPYLILDIGCNKGYTSADFLDALSPGTGMNPSSLVTAIREIAKEDNTKFDRDGGVCNDSNKPLNTDRNTRRDVEVHCFEPSPATYKMLNRARTKLISGSEGGAVWHIHNKGLHEVNSEMSWHKACGASVGDELCTIVDASTPDSIRVPVVTVDKFLEDTYLTGGAVEMPLVHMLKVDAEGLDPAVLNGASVLLKSNRAIMTMFEFNPGLSEGKDPATHHGMWGRNGNPKKTLLDVTDWLDTLGYDCYLDTHLPNEREKRDGVSDKPEDTPALYRITGGCMREEPRVRGWANVVCACRKFGMVAESLRKFATMVP